MLKKFTIYWYSFLGYEYTIAMSYLRGVNPSNGQALIARARSFIADLLDAIEKHTEIENPDQGVSGGLLTRTTLLPMVQFFMGRWGNYKWPCKI